MFRFLKKKKKQNSERAVATFLDTGFHGDAYLIQLVDFLTKDCEYFVETGTNVGSTLAYMARTYPNVSCVSCEPHKESYESALENVAEYSNAKIYNQSSNDFIEFIENDKSELFSSNVLFWLDAHGYGFEWPLKDEISFFTSRFSRGYILIDDFKVPELDCFKWDKYKEQVCSFDFIKDSIDDQLEIALYYPAYSDKTSKHHPLTGWGLIVFGHELELTLPASLECKVRRAL